MLLLLLLSRFSCVRLCNSVDSSPPGSPVPGFSRQEHWSGLPFPSPMHESEKWKWSPSVLSDSWWPLGLQPSRLLCYGIFQARVLEWGAIAFSACFLLESLKKPRSDGWCLELQSVGFYKRSVLQASHTFESSKIKKLSIDLKFFRKVNTFKVKRKMQDF